jgi:hypothetical protein
MSYKILFERVATVEVVSPLFVFLRRHEIEVEAGYLLAGKLIVDIPACDEIEDDDQEFIADILQRLSGLARSGHMPKNGYAIGWPGGAKPANAIDTDDDGLMSAWAEDRMIIEVRVDDRDHDGHLLIDGSILNGVMPKAGRA